MRPILLAVALLLTGCAKPDRPRVRISNLGIGLQTSHMPINLAASLGYYQDEGLEVTIENLPSLARTMQALIGGSVDVAGISYPQTIQMAAEGQRVRTFFVVTHRDSKVLVVTPSGAKKIRRIEDLKGAIIGIPSPGSPTHLWVQYLLQKHGVAPNEVSAVGIGGGASAFAAMESGRIDAAGMAGGDHLALLKRHPDLHILADDSTPEGMRETYGEGDYGGGALSARQEWLDRNPDTARRLARAMLRTLQWMAAHTPEEIRARMPEAFRSPDATLDCEIIRWGRETYTTDGAMAKDAPEGMKRYLDATIPKVREAKIDLAATWTNEFLPGTK
jgi:NitT/TauT family transport system substrate-binding protein